MSSLICKSQSDGKKVFRTLQSRWSQIPLLLVSVVPILQTRNEQSQCFLPTLLGGGKGIKPEPLSPPQTLAIGLLCRGGTSSQQGCRGSSIQRDVSVAGLDVPSAGKWAVVSTLKPRFAFSPPALCCGLFDESLQL